MSRIANKRPVFALKKKKNPNITLPKKQDGEKNESKQTEGEKKHCELQSKYDIISEGLGCYPSQVLYNLEKNMLE